jgi:hypothetical protein
MVRFLLLVSVLTGAVLGSARAADGWSKMKAGMSADETAAALGMPLLRTANRGYQLWTYSDKAEVVFYRGPVVAWTVPVRNEAASKRPVAMDVTVLPGAPLLRTAPVGPRSVLDRAYAAFPETRFRYNTRPLR